MTSKYQIKNGKVVVKELESDIVSDFIDMFYRIMPKYKIIRIPNEGTYKNKSIQKGTLIGCADFLFDYTSKFYDVVINNYIYKYRNLWIEFKTKTGKQSKKQVEFEKFVESNGSKYIICRSAIEAIDEIKLYLGL